MLDKFVTSDMHFSILHTVHSPSCSVFKHFASSERGGRSRKRKHPHGRPKEDGKWALHQYICNPKTSHTRDGGGTFQLAGQQCVDTACSWRYERHRSNKKSKRTSQ